MIEVEIKPKKGFLRLTPGAVTISQSIYFPPKIHKDLNLENPQVKNLAWLEHEKEHAQRQMEIGTRRWWRSYILNRNFRLEEELSAFNTQINYLKQHDTLVDVNKLIDQVTRKLSGIQYLWAGRRQKIIEYFKQQETIS